MDKFRLGIFGGTFNPIHIAHLRIAEEIRELLKLDEICFVPARMPPLKQHISQIDPQLRFELVQQSIKDNPRFSISDIEYQREGPSYTIDTLNTIIKERQLVVAPYFILGFEAFLDIKLWHNYADLFNVADFVIHLRGGYSSELHDFISLAKELGFDYNDSKGTEFESNKDTRHPTVDTNLPISRAHAHDILPNSSQREHTSTNLSTEAENKIPRMKMRLTNKNSRQLLLTEVTPLRISSTDIRQRIRNKESIKYLVPEVVFNSLMKGNIEL